jgi:hypothetical protein
MKSSRSQVAVGGVIAVHTVYAILSPWFVAWGEEHVPIALILGVGVGPLPGRKQTMMDDERKAP